MNRRLPIVLLAGACLAALAACSSGSSSDSGSSRAPAKASGLTDLDTILELRAAFNADRGKLRLLLLLSPT